MGSVHVSNELFVKWIDLLCMSNQTNDTDKNSSLFAVTQLRGRGKSHILYPIASEKSGYEMEIQSCNES